MLKEMYCLKSRFRLVRLCGAAKPNSKKNRCSKREPIEVIVEAEYVTITSEVTFVIRLQSQGRCYKGFGRSLAFGLCPIELC